MINTVNILSAVDGDRLAGSTRVRGPLIGDTVSLLCIILLTDCTYSFIMTFNIIEAIAESDYE